MIANTSKSVRNIRGIQQGFVTSSIVALALLLSACNFHYRQGVDLEEKKRWEESSIEYRLALVDSPSDEDIHEALARINPKVAADNLARYRDYLGKQQFRKAFRRLEAAGVLDPSLEEVKTEREKWTKVLLAGRANLEFDRVETNLRLADKMNLQVVFNTPTGKTIAAPISNETGIFFAEHLIYNAGIGQLTGYTINSIGLKMTRKTAEGLKKKEFLKFINYRVPLAEGIGGELATKSTAEAGNVRAHRDTLTSVLNNGRVPAFRAPRGLVRYSLKLEGNTIGVTDSKDISYLPDVLYVNNSDRRVFLDYGSLELQRNQEQRRWSIRRKVYLEPADDYFPRFAKNLALNPYFLYKEGPYRFVSGR